MAATHPDTSQAFGTSGNAEQRRRFDTLTLAVAYGLILLALWTPLPAQRIVSLLALAWVLVTSWISFDGWSALGLRSAGFYRSLWVVGAALLLSLVALNLAARWHTLHLPGDVAQFFRRYSGYVIWSFLQEFLMLNFFLLRFERLLASRRAAVLVTVILFAFAHMPNPILTALTLIWGWSSCLLFLRYRNLYTQAATHAILGICVAVTIPGAIDHNMRVGLGYLTYHPRFSAAR